MKAYTPAELFACNQWLSDWPEDMSYRQLIAKLKRDTWLGADSEIFPWQIVEDCTGDQIAHFIHETKLAAERLIEQGKA